MNEKVKESEFKRIFKKLWANKQSKAAIKLSFYFVFIALVLIIASVASSINKTSQSITFEEKYQELMNNNYSYKYIIKIDQNKYLFEGNKYQNIELGYMQSENNTSKYYINGINQYIFKLDDLEKVNTINEKIDFNYFNTQYIYSLIEQKDALKTSDYYSYSINGNMIKIYFDDNHINKVEINNYNQSYLLNYSKHGQIEQIEI